MVRSTVTLTGSGVCLVQIEGTDPTRDVLERSLGGEQQGIKTPPPGLQPGSLLIFSSLVSSLTFNYFIYNGLV
jgi:hypothetical protein